MLPKETLLSINSFIRDANDNNDPDLRKIAIRTMASLKLTEVLEYTIPVIKNALCDNDVSIQ